VLAGLVAGSMWLTPSVSAQTIPPNGVSAADNQNVQLVAQRGWGWGGGWGGYYNSPRFYYPRNYGSYYYPRNYGSYYYPRDYGSYYYPSSPYYGNNYAPSYSNCYYDYSTGTYVCYSPYHGWYRTY
jgi:hypothetical protein